ncbi:BZ3500_MvSof-1268-A1-R1_Chr1-3g02429 [Microbotryum saponariae]|uniref:BZ3500_MvSof-1268-A1-R1_Chr1-3g02429 protein n=1 Tax=Microbotryum saponariae TaxID=289078 RepID=A0A2X0KJ13_9BASI|nr:BZ3500_MvSof-1268-A1-R1_Chr1-3g02429 [Microbotryum saponariae]SCZ96216.1 BZ3501_MvSof-1269-A2-R1_Chr1-3g02032 [Microbotryum saponariae]
MTMSHQPRRLKDREPAVAPLQTPEPALVDHKQDAANFAAYLAGNSKKSVVATSRVDLGRIDTSSDTIDPLRVGTAFNAPGEVDVCAARTRAPDSARFSYSPRRTSNGFNDDKGCSCNATPSLSWSPTSHCSSSIFSTPFDSWTPPLAMPTVATDQAGRDSLAQPQANGSGSSPRSTAALPSTPLHVDPLDVNATLTEGRAPTSPLLRTPSGFEFVDLGDRSSMGDSRPRCFDWEVYGPDSPQSLNLTHASKQCFKRRLGPTEVSYYLGSRGEGVESGVNDMYLHIGFRAESHLMVTERLLNIWTEMTLRHQLLASSVEYHDVHEIRFVYEPPTSMAEARRKAKSLMELRTRQDPKALLDTYLNGDRTLSDARLSYLIFSTPDASFDAATEQEYDMYLFSTHFLGDGMALHTTANEIFTLLADNADAAEGAAAVKNLEAVLREQVVKPIFPEMASVVEDTADEGAASSAFPVEKLAQAMEAKLVTPEGWGRMAWAGARVEYNQSQAKLIGGHAFPRAKLGERKTLVSTVAYDTAKTKKILSNCKTHGTTISHAVFSLSNLAYIRSTPQRDVELPVMIYSALNMRGNLTKADDDWYHIAIGYYNIILPSFLPSTISVERTFWHRSSVVRKQTSAVVKGRWLAPRSKLMALERERRSIGFEREDERRRQQKLALAELPSQLQGLGISFEDDATESKLASNLAKTLGPVAPVVTPQLAESTTSPKAPSTALMGLSMLGNLDAIYVHKDYHGIQMHTLTTGSRQRAGAILLFAYTFVGKLWLSLGYDSNGFQQGVIESWWTEMQKGVDELLLPSN